MDHKLCIVDADSIIYKVSYTDKELNDCIDLMHGYINRIKNRGGYRTRTYTPL